MMETEESLRIFCRLLLVTLVLLLAACGGAPTGGAAPTLAIPTPAATASQPQPTTPPEPTALPEQAQPTTAQPQTTPAQPSGEAQGDTLIIYHKTGGIMGLDETLTVYADGRFELADKRGASQSGQAVPAELDALKQLLASPEFAALDPAYKASGADLFTYQITVPGTGKTVVTMDGAATPEVLGQVIEKLDALRGSDTMQAPAS
jgi:hypothetical protein